MRVALACMNILARELQSCILVSASTTFQLSARVFPKFTFKGKQFEKHVCPGTNQQMLLHCLCQRWGHNLLLLLLHALDFNLWTLFHSVSVQQMAQTARLLWNSWGREEMKDAKYHRMKRNPKAPAPVARTPPGSPKALPLRVRWWLGRICFRN